MIKQIKLPLNYHASANRTQEWFERKTLKELSELNKYLTAGYAIISEQQFHSDQGQQISFVLFKKRGQKEEKGS